MAVGGWPRAGYERLEPLVYYWHMTAMIMQHASPDFVAAREAMVESQLRPQGVSDLAVLDAMGSIQRERFLPTEMRALAYVDRGVAIGGGRYIPAPAVLGQLLNQMEPEQGQRALVIGSGTGYSSAVLAAIGVDVVALECDPDLLAVARELGINVIEGPLELGLQKAAPYHHILIDGAVAVIPDAIVDQLADGGRLGTAIIDRGITRLVVGRKVGGAFGYRSFGDAGVPALPGFGLPEEFTF